MKKAILCSCFVIFLPLFSISHGQQSEKKKISNIDDLPRYTYEISGTLTELITDEKTFKPFADQVRANIEHDLETYDIGDETTLKKFYGVLVTLNILAAEYERALTGIARIRDLEDKPADELTTNLISEAMIRAQVEGSGRQGFVQYLAQAIEELPRELVQDRIEAIKGDLEMSSRNIVLGIIQSQYEPGVQKSHQIGNDVAFDMIDTYYLLEVVLPRKEAIIEVLDKYITTGRVEKHDIWKARQVDLSEIADLTPVVIAIWDTGVDVSIFPDRLFVNHEESVNGNDDDSNGYIDDVHGVAYTLDVDKTHEILYPIEHPESLHELKDLIKGLNDIQAAIASPEAAELKKRLATMNPEEVRPFVEQIMQFAVYMHGTYTAGLAVEANPYARILVVRLTDDYRMVPLPATLEKSRKWAVMFQDVIDYFKVNGVRVVNMSWTGRLRARENNLEVNAIGENGAERARLAREMFDIEKEALFEAMKNAPEILFVTSAGNEDDNVAFEDHYPNAFDLSNLLVVGAVDQAGDETSFTSFGETVDVYANGFEVESYIPGGERLPASGTSAASPNAANLAAKLLAVEPMLTPEGVIALIKEGADQNQNGRLLINPKRALEMLKMRQGG
jgi:subtilisin family serine protease